MKNPVPGSQVVFSSSGVFRCCLQSIGERVDYTQYYDEGHQFSCEYCYREFVLVGLEILPTDQNDD